MDFSFMLNIETEHSLNESFNDKMYNLSPWLARFIAEICDIESYVIDSQTQETIQFIKRHPERE